MVYEKFALLGLSTGAMYALAALGLVITYRASGVLNFATGAMGASAAYLTYSLRDDHGVPTVVAALLGLLLGAALGVLLQILVSTVLRRASPLSKLIATLAVLSLLQAGITLIWGATNRGQPASLLPRHLREVLPGIRITEDRLLLIAIAVVTAGALAFLYRKTPFGVATAAVAENRQVAAIAGLSATRIELLNFALAGAVAAGAAIMLAPILSLDVTALVITVVPALASALVGRFESFMATTLAAMVIGVAQAEIPQLPFVRHRADGAFAGLADAVPVLIIVAVIAARGRGRQSRAEAAPRLPRPGSGRITARTAGSALIVSAVAVTVTGGWNGAVVVTAAMAVIVLSVVVVSGFAGQLSLAQFAIAGFGLWAAARLYAHGWPFLLAFVVGVMAAVPAGLIVALPALRARGVDLAIATLGLALAIQDLVLGNSALTGGFSGTDVHGASIGPWNIDPVDHPHRYATFALLGLFVTSIVVSNLRRGRSGRRLLAVRGNERAAASLGVSVYGTKLYAFAVSAAIAAVGGIILGFKDQTVRFDQITIFGSISAVQLAVVGGLGFVGGAAVGACLTAGGLMSQAVTELHASATVDTWLAAASGVVVLAVLRLAPNGLAAWSSRLKQRSAMATSEQKRAAAPLKRGGAPLVVRGASVRFGGVIALQGIDITVAPGEVVGLIGPNGAGKTTLIDVVTGFTRLHSGSVQLGSADITRWTPERRARAGLTRSFQSLELFADLSVRENLLVGCDRMELARYLTDLLMPGEQAPTAAMTSLIERFHLGDVLDERPEHLSQAQARQIGLARAMCTEPSILLLDEPAAGLDGPERAELASAVRTLAHDAGVGILLVEHDVPMVMAICDRVVALDNGRVICTGQPGEVASDPAVLAAYLGEQVAT